MYTKTTRKLIDLLRMMMIHQFTCLNMKIYMQTSIDRAKKQKEQGRKESAPTGRGRGGKEGKEDDKAQRRQQPGRGEEERRGRNEGAIGFFNPTAMHCHMCT